MKKNFPYFVFCILYFVFGMHAFAECNENAKSAGYDSYSEGKYSYECNVKNSCLGKKFGGGYWNFDTSKQIIKKHDKTKYPNLSKEGKTITDIKKIYQTTQDTIFECAILKSKYTAHEQIMDEYKPSTTQKTYLKKLNESVKKSMKDKECLSADDNDKVYNYKDLLDSLSYEECVYNMYLYYYQETAENNIGTLFGKTNGALISLQDIYPAFMWLAFAEETSGTMNALEIAETVEDAQNELQNEYDLSSRSLSSALSLYENFHKTYVPHVLLDMTYVELSETKTYMSRIMHGIKQIISNFVGAQKENQ